MQATRHPLGTAGAILFVGYGLAGLVLLTLSALGTSEVLESIPLAPVLPSYLGTELYAALGARIVIAGLAIVVGVGLWRRVTWARRLGLAVASASAILAYHGALIMGIRFVGVAPLALSTTVHLVVVVGLLVPSVARHLGDDGTKLSSTRLPWIGAVAAVMMALAVPAYVVAVRVGVAWELEEPVVMASPATIDATDPGTLDPTITLEPFTLCGVRGTLPAGLTMVFTRRLDSPDDSWSFAFKGSGGITLAISRGTLMGLAAPLATMLGYDDLHTFEGDIASASVTQILVLLRSITSITGGTTTYAIDGPSIHGYLYHAPGISYETIAVSLYDEAHEPLASITIKAPPGELSLDDVAAMAASFARSDDPPVPLAEVPAIGLSAAEQGDWATASLVFADAYCRVPGDVKLTYALAHSLWQSKRVVVSSVEALIDQILDADPEDEAALQLLLDITLATTSD